MKLKDALLEVNQAVIRLGDINKLYELILDKVIQCMENAELGCVLIMGEDETLTMAAWKGYDDVQSEQFRLKLRDSFVWNKTKGNFCKTVIMNDIQQMIRDDYPAILDNYHGIYVESSISAPIILDDKLYGLINIDSGLRP